MSIKKNKSTIIPYPGISIVNFWGHVCVYTCMDACMHTCAHIHACVQTYVSSFYKNVFLLCIPICNLLPLT